MGRLFADENFPLPVVQDVRRLGHDVVTIQDTGHANRALPDEAVLGLARDDHRAILTLNRRHFVRLHETGVEHAGIIVCTLDLDFDGQAARIHVAVVSRESLKGQLIRINRPR